MCIYASPSQDSPSSRRSVVRVPSPLAAKNKADTHGKPCNVGPILHLGHSRGETCRTLSGKPILATQFGVRQHALTDPAI